MQLSRRAEELIAELARQQGLSALEFDQDGLIPIRLGGETQVAIGYSPANDALLLIGVVDPAPDRHALDCWDILSRNAALAERRTRLALEPSTNGLVLCCDIYVQGLDLRRLNETMDRFVEDFGKARDAGRARSQPFRPLPADELEEASSGMMVFRP